MKPNPPKFLLIPGLLATLVLPAAAADKMADQLLRQMSAKLAAARTFSFKATREIDVGLLEGSNVPEKAKIAVAVQRPDKLAAESRSQAGVRRFVADGSTLALVDERNKLYAKVPMRTNIDGRVSQIDTKYGFVPPLAEFALSDPYKDFRRQASTVNYLGLAKTKAGFLGLFGEECHRLELKGKEADAELWIAVSDQLPRKLTATFHREGNPQVRITFSKWNLAAAVTTADFAFNPPKGSQQIEMWTTAKMKSSVKP